MKSISIRKLDELGRVVIPMEVRNKLKILDKDPMEICVSGNSIFLKKVEESCIFCGNNKNLHSFKDKKICEDCVKTL